MSKVLPATCKNGVVKCEDVVIDDAVILSKGVGESSGILIVEEDKSTYVATNATDIQSLLADISSALGNISSCLTSLDGGRTTGSPIPPVLAALITAIDNSKASLDQLRGNLK